MAETLTPETAVCFARKVEAQGAEFYSALAQKFADDKEISDLFSSLSEDEKHHETQFKELAKLVTSSENGGLTRRQTDYLEAMALSFFFTAEDGPFCRVHEVKNRDDALAMVLEFEKATLGYYQAMKEALGEIDVLVSLIDTEKQHIVSVAKVMIAGSKFRSISDPW